MSLHYKINIGGTLGKWFVISLLNKMLSISILVVFTSVGVEVSILLGTR